jgi:hypothetical protein
MSRRVCCEACQGMFVEKCFLWLCAAPPQGLWLCKAPHDSGACCCLLLEEVFVCGGVSFHPPCTSRVDEEICVRVTGRHSTRVASVVYCLISSVAGGVEVRPPLGYLGRALFSQALLVRRCHPGVASWL